MLTDPTQHEHIHPNKEDGYIIRFFSQSCFQRDLIKNAISASKNPNVMACNTGNPKEAINNFDELFQYGPDSIVIWDSHIKETSTFIGIFKNNYNSNLCPQTKLILINLPTNASLNHLPTWGVSGVIFEDSSLNLLLKAVEAVRNGELWFPRRVINKLLTKRLEKESKPTLPTKRETEILTLVAKGLSNNEIASKLCLSKHTVKSHVYNLFKKIGVSNRVGASIWVNINMPELTTDTVLNSGIWID